MNNNDTIDALVERKVKQAVNQYLAKSDVIKIAALKALDEHTATSWVRSEIKTTAVPMVDEHKRTGYFWSEDEDRKLAKELRQALTDIALKHERSHHDIVCRIRDKKIIF